VSSVAEVIRRNKTGSWDISGLEVLGGRFVIDEEGGGIKHGLVISNIFCIFDEHLQNSNLQVHRRIGVFLTDEDMAMPDIMIVGDNTVSNNWGVFGSPDIIVEVISCHSEARDKGYKKDLYERCGVGEYWIVDAERQIIEIYLLADDKYVLGETSLPLDKSKIFEDIDI